MSIIRFNPMRYDFPTVSRVRDWFDEHNFASESTTMPAVNVKETDDDYRVEVAAPGLKRDDFKITVDDNIMTISSEKTTEDEETTGNVTRREFSYSSFKRSFTLSDTVDADGISATYKDGILNVVVPKKEEAKTKPPRRIEIQ